MSNTGWAKIHILERIQYHFYENTHPTICFLVMLSQWEKKAWGNSWEAGNTRGWIRWLGIIDHVHRGPKKHVDSYSGDLGAESRVRRVLSDSLQEIGSYPAPELSLTHMGLVCLKTCFPALLQARQGQESYLFPPSLSPRISWACMWSTFKTYLCLFFQNIFVKWIHGWCPGTLLTSLTSNLWLRR